MILIFKSGENYNLANYKPVSLLCMASSSERLIYNHLINFLTDTFSGQQLGFLAGHSALQQLLLFISNTLEAKTNHANTGLIF